MDKQITITVSGRAGSGKSAMIALLKDFLTRYEFDVAIESESECKGTLGQIRQVSENYKILLVEKQEPRANANE